MNVLELFAAMGLGAYVLLLVQVHVGIRDDRRAAKARVVETEARKQV